MKCKLISELTVSAAIFVIIGASFTPVTGSFLNDNKNPLSVKQVDTSDDFDQKIIELMKQAKLPSLSLGLIKNNSLIFSRGFGKYNLFTGKQPTNETIYAIGSISKSITATALMQLYEQKKFKLDDNVSKWLPFNLKNLKYPDINITFRMLLAHQSSLYDHNIESIDSLIEKIGLLRTLKMFFNFPFIPKIMKEPYPMLKELLVPGGRIYMPELWMDYPPGAEANYSNLGYVILGYLVELISNQSIEEYCQKNIFDPLHMKDTRFHPNGLERQRIAVPYITDREGRLIRLPNYDFLYFSPAGGIRTTVEDLSHYLIAHMNNGTYNEYSLLNSSTIRLMHTIQYPNSSYNASNTSIEMKFGLGWLYTTDENNDTWGGHLGSAPGCVAFMRLRVSDNRGFIAYYNRTGFNESERKAVNSIIQVIKEKLNEI